MKEAMTYQEAVERAAAWRVNDERDHNKWHTIGYMEAIAEIFGVTYSEVYDAVRKCLDAHRAVA